jgi:ribonuclease HI
MLFEEGKLIGEATNNEAEYRALIHLLEKVATDPVLLAKSGAKHLRIHSDSKLLVEQVTGKWKIKEPRLQELFNHVQVAKAAVPFTLRIKHIPREDNKRADQLVNQALDKVAAVPPASEYSSF